MKTNLIVLCMVLSLLAFKSQASDCRGSLSPTDGESYKIGDFAYPPVGMTAQMTLEITEELIDQTARLTGDRNIIHMNADFARRLGQRGRIAHGITLTGLASNVMGNLLPGPGSIAKTLSFELHNAAVVGDIVTALVTVVTSNPQDHLIDLEVLITNQKGDVVLTGSASVKYIVLRGSARTRVIEYLKQLEP